MVAMPAFVPVTSPVGSSITKPGVPVDQNPPVVASVNVIVLPTHTELGPTMGVGAGLTVMAYVATGHAGTVYIIVSSPGSLPKTSPETASADAIKGNSLLHIP